MVLTTEQPPKKRQKALKQAVRSAGIQKIAFDLGDHGANGWGVHLIV
jgi:hypothetical protein